MARRMLGLGIGSSAPRETLGEADLEAVAATSEGCGPSRCCKSASRDRAEAELRQLWPSAQGSRRLAAP